MCTKLYWFRFSPPARLAKLAAAICDVHPDYIEVDLSKGEQFSSWYLAINSKHKVPVLEEDGVYIDESLDIVRHLFNKYNRHSDNDHWYPKDPEKRAKVDSWMEWAQKGKGDWTTALHLTIRTAVVLAHMAPQHGMGWRDHYGAVLCLVGFKSRRDKQALADLNKQLDVAENVIGQRRIAKVEDLNLGDLSAFMEISVVMECMEGFNWKDYPALDNLYQLCRDVPGFMEVHEPFLEFCREYRHHRDMGTTAGWLTLATQVVTSVKTFFKIASVELGWFKGLIYRPELDQVGRSSNNTNS